MENKSDFLRRIVILTAIPGATVNPHGTRSSELIAVYGSSTIELGGKKYPLYNQIRYMDEKGQELIRVHEGQLASDLKFKGNESWYKEVGRLKRGEISNSGAVLAENTQKPERRLTTPVIVGDRFRGAVTLSMNWQLI